MPDQRPAPRGVPEQTRGPDPTRLSVDLDSLSNELRTSLQPVLTTLQALREDTRLPAELLPKVDSIQGYMANQARVIDDLLDLTRLMRGQLPMALRPADVHRVIEEVCEAVRPALRDERLSMDLGLEAKASMVRLDADRLRQALKNIVDNAIKFTPEGGRITVRTSERGGMVEIEIKDTGVGMASDDLMHVFGAFARPREGQGQRRGPGVGLGLALTHGIIQLHQGRIEVDSEGPGLGTRVVIELPLVDQAAAATRETPAAVASILLVDDHEDTLMLMKMMLERRGYEVTAAGSAAEARAAAKERRFDLLISDINLPDASGLDLLRDVSSLGTTRAVALSGFGRDADIKKSREAGFLEHLVKPVNMQRLQDIIQKALAR